MRRNREFKANTPRVSGRGGIGNITESYPRSPTKPLRRASLFKGGGGGLSPVSTGSEGLNMNAYDDEERRNYALWRHSDRQSVTSISGPGSGGNSPLSPDSEYSESELGSTSSVSIHSLPPANLTIPESPTSPASSTFSTSTTSSKQKHILAGLWKKVAKSKRKHAHGRDFKQDLILRAQIAASAHPHSFDNSDHNDNFPDFAGDPVIGQELYVGRAL